MKQTVFALAFVAIAFASCKNQTEAPVVEETTTTETVTEQATPVVNTNAELVGTWTQPNGAKPELLQGFELKADSTLVAVEDPAMMFTKWKVVDNTLVFESEVVNNDPSTAKVSIFKFEIVDGKTLKLDVDGVIEEFTKQ